jgi:hypothetical protein
MNDLAPNHPTVNWDGARYELTSDKPMTLVSWGLPPSPTDGHVDPILTQNIGPGTTIFLQINTYAYLPKYYLLQPYVLIDEQLVKCPEVKFAGDQGSFLLSITHRYDLSLRVHSFYLVNHYRYNYDGQCQILTQVDGVNVVSGTSTLPYTKNFQVDEEDYEKGLHELTILVSSMGEEKEFKYNIFGAKVAGMTFTEVINHQNTQDMLQLNTNRKLTAKIEVYVDGVLINTFSNDQISVWPFSIYLKYINYEPGPHNWWCKIIDTATNDQVETTHYAFTGTKPTKIPITYGANVTDLANQASLTKTKGILYKFNGTEGDLIRIAVNAVSGATDSYVALYSPTMTLLTLDDDSGGSGNALISSYRLPTTGEYTIDSCWWGYTGNSGYLQTILTKLDQ